MAKIQVKNGAGSIVLRLKVYDATVASGAGKTGLAPTTPGLIISTIADVESLSIAYRAASGTIESIPTLGSYTAPTAGRCRFREIDPINHPGLYELHLANARFAVSGARSLLITIGGVAGAAQCDAEVQLTAIDPNDAIRFGLLALPGVAASASGGLPTVDASNAVKVQSGIGANQILLSAGKVTVGTNTDKAGYGLSQGFPANFASLVITASGEVRVGVNNDKGGYSLAASQSFSTTGAVGGVTAPVQIDLQQAVPASNAPNAVGDCLNAARAQGFGKWVKAGSSLTLYAPDGLTVVRSFALDDATDPSMRS